MKILFSFVIVALCAVANAEDFPGYDMHDAVVQATLCSQGKKFLSRAEFEMCFGMAVENKKNLYDTNPRKLDEKDLNALYKLFDKSHNGQVDRREFIIGFPIFREYEYYDKNHDNILSKDELMNMFDTDEGDGEPTASFTEFYHRVVKETKLSKTWKDNLGK